ncbi:MAG: hypothetical protein ACOY7U_06800, partial [Acidobacteriota bacterium]
MLAAVGLGWDSLTPVQDHHVELLIEKGFFLQAVELLRKKLSHHRVFGFKDPRLCKLLPFWKRVFGHLGVPTYFIIPIRNPIAVANSLKQRNNMPLGKSLCLWMEHILAPILHTAHEKKVFVDYDLFLQSPEKELQRLSEFLGTGFNHDEFAIFEADFLDRALRHWHFDPADLKARNLAPRLVSEIYLTLQKLASLSNANEFLLPKRVSRWISEYRDMIPLLVLIDEFDSQIGTLQSQWQLEKTTLGAKYDDLLRRYGERQAEVDRLGGELAEWMAKYQQLVEQYGERQREVERLTTLLSEKQREVENLGAENRNLVTQAA